MENNNSNNFLNDGTEAGINMKKELFKYLFFWKWFVLSILVSLVIASAYIRYTHNIYSTSAKIKILDKKEASLELPSASDLFNTNKINLENEIQLLSSYTILSKVVQELNLNTNFYSVGDIKTKRVINYPFQFEQLISNDSISEDLIYNIYFNDSVIEIIDVNNDNTYFFSNYSTFITSHNLPFNVKWDKSIILSNNNNRYKIVFSSVKNSFIKLQKDILLSKIGNESDIIELRMQNENSEYSEIILNKLIYIFNKDGVDDRRMIHKRTIDFVNERYILLSQELDSIEIVKQLYKISNNLIDINANSSLSLNLSSKSNQQLLDLENQISIAKLLKESFEDNNYDLLPSNIGIDNSKINILISSFNELIIKRKNLVISAGLNNPSVLLLNNIINDSRLNILLTINNYLKQLSQSKIQLTLQSRKFKSDVSVLPENEKILRAIERNQIIKESLYLFLLQKREESEVSFAVTEPTIKVVEYAFSSNAPILPKKQIIFLLALLISIIIPFICIYLLFLFNTKIHSKEDINELNLGGSVIGEIPQISDGDVTFRDPTHRSVLAESFRMLSSNLKYMLPNIDSCNVIISTSTIKGEGKTFSAINTSLALSSLNKKVLLIGCDLRNPQLHKYLNIDKSGNGLVNYLVNNKNNWRNSLINFFEHHPTHDILLSGALPPNPVQLLNNGNLEKLLNDAKNDYDYIILDTAPTILVTDTITIANHADAIIYVSRANLTEKEVLSFPKELIKSGKFKNVGFVINGLGAQNKYGYSYGYQYGYGYKYSYNYGYGYGYEEEKS